MKIEQRRRHVQCVWKEREEGREERGRKIVGCHCFVARREIKEPKSEGNPINRAHFLQSAQVWAEMERTSPLKNVTANFDL